MVDLRDWLPEDDLVWHVLDVIDQLDLTEFYARYRINGQGGAAYDPAMMVALTVYAHAVRCRACSGRCCGCATRRGWSGSE